MLNAPRLAKIRQPSIKSLVLTGGLNEQVTNYELSGGELTIAENYVERDGGATGYTSFQGYERYDGQTSPASVGVTLDPLTGIVSDDTAREAARTAILPIPGSGNTSGVAIFKDEVYGFRDDATPTAVEMYKATAGGWSKITAGTGVAGGAIQSVVSRFALHDSNNEQLIWVDGVSDVHIYNGTTITLVTSTTAPTLPAGVYPTHCGVWQGRLFLAYPKGSIYFSVIGDPTDFDPVSGAGMFDIGDDLTGFSVTPGGDLLLAMRNQLDFITDTTASAVGSAFSFDRRTFSHKSGAIANTVQRMLGTLYYADDRGVTTLEATDTYGDFAANSLAKKVERTYQAQKANIVLSIVSRQDNQYILFFNGPDVAEGLVFSFKGKRIKGATKIKLKHKVFCSAAGKSTSYQDRTFFGGADGYVYQLFTGTSFDGEIINASLATSFHHYGTPTRWKHFRDLTLEVTGEPHTSISYRAEFDYNELYQPTTVAQVSETASTGGIWGASVWGAFYWGGNTITRIKNKILGYGSNMRVLIVTADKYKTPHSLHNMTVQYTNGSVKH